MASIKSTVNYSYDTISSPPMEPTPSLSDSSFLSRAKSTTQSLIATQRPWRDLYDPSLFSVPLNYDDAMSRIRQNVNYFRVNYTLVMLLMVFFSLFWHPISLIVFLLIFIGWLYLYFFRNEPLVLFNQSFDDKVVLGVLSLVTIIALVSTDVGSNVLGALIAGVVVVALHAAFRITADHFVDEVTVADGGFLPVVGNQHTRN